MFSLDTKSNTPKETRNIIDHYWYWSQDEIVADIKQKSWNFSILCCNLANDFNISSTIRNANGLGAREVIIWGSKHYDKRGTVGTHKYTPIKHFKEEEISDLLGYIGDSKLIGIDNVPEAKNIIKYVWPKDHFVMVFGQEQIGIYEPIKSLCSETVYIPQLGSVRSLNVACASSIALYDYCLKQSP